MYPPQMRSARNDALPLARVASGMGLSSVSPPLAWTAPFVHLFLLLGASPTLFGFMAASIQTSPQGTRRRGIEDGVAVCQSSTGLDIPFIHPFFFLAPAHFFLAQGQPQSPEGRGSPHVLLSSAGVEVIPALQTLQSGVTHFLPESQAFLMAYGRRGPPISLLSLLALLPSKDPLCPGSSAAGSRGFLAAASSLPSHGPGPATPSLSGAHRFTAVPSSPSSVLSGCKSPSGLSLQ
jgi:hypothetical protein